MTSTDRDFSFSLYRILGRCDTVFCFLLKLSTSKKKKISTTVYCLAATTTTLESRTQLVGEGEMIVSFLFGFCVHIKGIVVFIALNRNQPKRNKKIKELKGSAGRRIVDPSQAMAKIKKQRKTNNNINYNTKNERQEEERSSLCTQRVGWVGGGRGSEHRKESRRRTRGRAKKK